jgi:hypothetical protein
MKKHLLSLFAVATAMIANAQCNEVIISEIVEGWSNNKAVEIYNPTGTAKDMTGYGIVRFSNGSASYGEITPFDGLTIQPNDVLVVVLDKRDSLGTGLEYPVWDELQAKADIFVSPSYDNGIWAMYFNGNDAIAIVKDNGQTLLDMFGRIGEGNGFGGWSAYATDTTGAPLYASQDHTMLRKSNVTSGITTNPSTFDVFAQYDTLPANTFDNLGFHTCDCAAGVSERENLQLAVYPNPIQNGMVSIVAQSGIESVLIYDMNGRLVGAQYNVNDRMTRFNAEGISSGMYWIEARMSDGSRIRKNLIK